MKEETKFKKVKEISHDFDSIHPMRCVYCEIITPYREMFSAEGVSCPKCESPDYLQQLHEKMKENDLAFILQMAGYDVSEGEFLREEEESWSWNRVELIKAAMEIGYTLETHLCCDFARDYYCRGCPECPFDNVVVFYTYQKSQESIIQAKPQNIQVSKAITHCN